MNSYEIALETEDIGQYRFGINKTTKNVFVDLENERDQIWAEAVARFKIGEPLYLTGNVLQEAEKEQAARLITDPWELKVKTYLAKPIPIGWFDMTLEQQRDYWILNKNDTNAMLVERDRVCASELLELAIQIPTKNQTSLDRKRVIDIIRKMSDYHFEKTIRFGQSYGRTSGFIKQK